MAFKKIIKFTEKKKTPKSYFHSFIHSSIHSKIFPRPLGKFRASFGLRK